MHFPRARTRAAVLALVVAMSSAAGGLLPATAAEASLNIRGVAGVQARGAALAVDLGLTCSAEGSLFDLRVTATQMQADGAVVTGRADTRVNCIGTPQVIRVAISSIGLDTPELTASPFRPGVAFVSARASYCGVSGCVPVGATRTVQTPALLMDDARSITPQATINLPTSAPLEADGAGVRVRIFHRCTSRGTFQARLVQRTSADAVSGYRDAEVPLTCVDASRSVVVMFHAGATVWRTGKALLIIDGLTCDGVGMDCHAINAHRTLSLT